MQRIQAVPADQVTPKAKELLEGVQKKLGMTPNMMKTMANSAAVLEGYLSLSGALGHGVLPAKLREQLALAIAEENACSYCRAAHSAIGKMVGLNPEAILDARRGSSQDAKTQAALQFARIVTQKKGHVSDADLVEVRKAGYNDGEIGEIIAHVALNVFTNYFNETASTEIDFPKVV
ncbi:MAG TPA: carboxymuconolactone decarboxylase family protein [Pirellulales bacterium]|nr:carboxymuconolactone decarboxylase family protein [Pirellulales bacterium]